MNIDEASVALVESGHAAKLFAAVGADLRATLVHAYACSVDSARQRVSVTLDRRQAAPLLAVLPGSGRVTLVACHIQTLESVQVKGDGAQLAEATAAERAAAVAHGETFARFGATLGHREAMMRAHMGCRAPDVVTVRFTIRQAFVQTPGPRAGQPLAPPP